MIKIRNEQEKEQFFNEHIKKDGAYFNVKYPNGGTEFIWVKKFENWKEDGSNWFLEYLNQLMKHNVTEEGLKPYYFEQCYIEGNFAYEINSWQTSPFLPEEFEIEFVTDIETKAVQYMIQLVNN